MKPSTTGKRRSASMAKGSRKKRVKDREDATRPREMLVKGSIKTKVGLPRRNSSVPPAGATAVEDRESKFSCSVCIVISLPTLSLFTF